MPVPSVLTQATSEAGKCTNKARTRLSLRLLLLVQLSPAARTPRPLLAALQLLVCTARARLLLAVVQQVQTQQAVARLELLHLVSVVVDEREASRLSTAELRLEAEKHNAPLV